MRDIRNIPKNIIIDELIELTSNLDNDKLIKFQPKLNDKDQACIIGHYIDKYKIKQDIFDISPLRLSPNSPNSLSIININDRSSDKHRKRNILNFLYKYKCKLEGKSYIFFKIKKIFN